MSSQSESKSLTEIIGRYVFFGLTAILVFVVPLLVSKQYFFPFIVPRSVFFMVMVELLVITWAVLHYFKPKQYRFPWKNPIVVGTGALLASWTISGLFGADWVLSFWSTYQRMTGILLLIHLFLWIGVSMAVLREEKAWNRLLSIFSLTGVLVSLYTILGPHGFSILKTLDMSRGGATIGNTSFLGAYVLFTIFVTLILAVRRKGFSKKWQIVHWISLAIMVFSPAVFNFKIFFGEVSFSQILSSPFVLLGQARAVAASIAVGVIMAAGLYLLRQKAAWKKVSGLVVAGGIAIASIAAMIMLFIPGNKVYNEFGEMTNWARYVIWEEAVTAFKEKPLLGWGPESFDLLHQRQFDPRLLMEGFGGELWFDRAHNLAIDIMFSTGIVGVLAFAGLIAALFLVVYRLRKSGKIGDAESALIGGMIFAYLLQDMTVFDMTVSYVAFFFILAYVGAKYERADNYPILSWKKNEAAWGVSHTTVAILMVVMMFGASFRVLTASHAINKSLVVESPQKRMELYEKAFSLPSGRTLFLRTISTRLFDTIRTQPQLVNEATRPILQAEATFFEDALAYEAEKRPYNFRAYISAARMAQLRAFLGEVPKIDDGIRYAEEAIKIAPSNGMGHLTHAELLAMAGRFDEARTALDRMLATAPGSVFLRNAHQSTNEIITATEAPLLENAQ